MAKKSAKPREPTPPWKVVAVLAGLGAIVVGIFLFGYGLKPGGVILDVVMAGSNANEAQINQIEPAMGEMMSTPRVAADIAGLILGMGGFIAVKMGMSPPKPKSVEQLVQEEVGRRLGELHAKGGSDAISVNLLSGVSAPNIASPGTYVGPQTGTGAPAPVAQVVPESGSVAAAQVRPAGTHCSTCGRLLLAGRFCRVCDAR